MASPVELFSQHWEALAVWQSRKYRAAREESLPLLTLGMSGTSTKA
jgi:hypothetical protein